MKLTRTTNDRNIIINTEQDFQTDLGWQENLVQLEDEVLKDIINPVDNYETVRYIHKTYDKTISGVTLQQTDIWFNFYFLSGSTYVQNYEAIGITNRENELMLRQSTESFFRLEFFKTPWISGNTYEAPNRKNRRLVFTKNLSLPLGEKFLYTNSNSSYKIHLPIFTGSNYRNKENMYLFWFEDDKVLEETNLIGTETGNTFFMTAKFYNAKDGSIIDFNNRVMSTGETIDERYDMYYQVDFDLTGRTYCIHTFTGGTPTFHSDCNVSSRRGNNITGTSINFFEKGGVILLGTPTPTPTNTSTPTPTPTNTMTPTPTSTGGGGGITYYYYALGDCQDMRYTYSQVTNTGFGIIRIDGLCGLPSDMDYSDPAHTAYYWDTSNPCGFGTGYAGTYNARSSTQLTEGDVYIISGICYSIIELNSEPPTWTIDMDGRTKETGSNPCFDCQPPFTGFTYYSYSGITCDNDEIIVYSILPYALNNDPTAIRSPQLGQLYLYHEYDVNGTLINPGNSCVEITGYIGEFVGPKVTVPLPGGISGSTYSVPVGPILTGGGEINDCTECIPHWNITTVRCDGDLTDLIGYPIWSTTKPAIDSVIKTNANDGVCRKVTDVFPLKQIPYLGGFVGSMHTQIYYVSSSYGDCSSCS